jgi:alginate O-acetyltransferase complex protein AlgI
LLFYSQLFLFIFLPLGCLAFFLAKGRYKNLTLIIASLLFYFWGEPTFLPIAVLSAAADFFICQHMFKHRSTAKARIYLTLGIVLNVSLLCYFKYMDFFIDTVNHALQFLHWQSWPLLNIALPIGVSFIVFEKITYLVDVYRGIGPPARSLSDYLLYIFLFPKLLAGPIVKYHDIRDQLENHRVTYDGFLVGFRRFLLGLIKKVVLADTVAEAANTVFALPPEQVGFFSAWLGVITFTLEIYLDFSAYSDMAIGLARMFGFKLLENFNMPYISTSFTDFWRRWHISLSTWIKEYLYFPLGGNRTGKVRTYFNLWICFLISGLWHGASWTFVLWGAYNGLFLVIDKLFWLRLSAKIPRLVNIGFTLLCVMIGWVIFRSTSLTQIQAFFSAMVHPGREGTFVYVTNNVWVAIIVGSLISIVPAFFWYETALKFWKSLRASLSVENWTLFLTSCFAILRIITSKFNPFLYFRF